MTYWLKYDQATNALIGVSDTQMHDTPGAVVKQFEGDSPDMTRKAWNAATRSWYDLYRNVLSKREFLKKFTPEEFGNIKAACLVNSTVDYYWQLFTLAEEVNMSDPDTVKGIHMLEMAGLIGPGRAAEILA